MYIICLDCATSDVEIACGSSKPNRLSIEDIRCSGLSIISPNYPSNYPDNSDCEWAITAPQGFFITLTFPDFDVEKE